MKAISTTVKNMIDSGRMVNPSCRLITDIDPPFVGLDTLMEDAAYPYLYESEGITYLSVVKSAGIFIYRVDDFEKRALTLVHSITAANVKNARIAFDGTNFHAVWENGADGKIYAYNGTVTAELATGTCPDILYSSAIYYFWAGSDGIYQKTGDKTETIAYIDAGETIKGLRVFLMPTGETLPVYVVETPERDEVRVVTSETEEKHDYVTDLNPVPGAGWKAGGKDAGFDVWSDGTPLQIGSTVFKKGIGMGVRGGIDNYTVGVWINNKPKKYTRVRGVIGPDANKPSSLYYSCSFRIMGTNEYGAWGITYFYMSNVTSAYQIDVDISRVNDGGQIYFECSGNDTYPVWGDLRFIYNSRIVKTIHTAAKGTLDRLQGSFSGNNIYVSWYQNGLVFGKALYDIEGLKETVEKWDYLSDMTPKSQRASEFNRWSDGTQMSINGVKFEKAIGGYIPYTDYAYTQYANFTVGKKYKRFEACCGHDDNHRAWTYPSLHFRVMLWGNNALLTDVYSGSFCPPKQHLFNLDMNGVVKVEITMGGLYDCWGVWGDPKLVYDYIFYNFEKARWTAATQFCTEFGDGLPVLHVSDGEPDLVIFEREGNLVCGPKILQSNIQSADCTLTTRLESGSFGVDFVNRSGQFSKGDLSQLFDGEKTLGLEIGYNGEFVRIATSQVDSDNANRSRAGGIFSVETKNKFYDLIQLPVTRNYGRRFNIGSKTMMISGYSLTDEIAAGGTAEVRIDTPNGKRWIPGSVEITNLSYGIVAGPVYGQTEFFAFVRLANTTEEAITPTFDVSAEDCTGLARKVGRSVKVTGEEKTLTGTTAFRLTNKSADNSQVQFVTVTDADGKTYSNGDDYILDVDLDGYTTIARAAESTILDGATVKVSYTYISTFTFSLTFDNEKSKQDFYELASLSQPESYQIVITSVTGKTIDNYYQTYRPLHIFYAAAVNGAGVQIVLNDNASLTVNFEIWSRPMEKDQPFGYYWTVDEIFKDLAKHAAYKDVKFYEYEGKLEAGQFTSLDDNGKDLFVLMEEGFDIDTLRVENTGTDDVNVSIIEAGYIVDNDNRQNWGARIAVTRAAYSGVKISYSFQLWGQYINRKDFLPHFPVALVELPQTQLTKPLKVKDISIEEAAKKALQICFFDGVPFRMFAGARGEWTFKPHKGGRLDEIAHAFHVRNMAQIVWRRKTPLVIDRVEIKGSISESYLVASEMELAYNQNSDVIIPAKTAHLHLTINFDKLYDVNSYEFRNIWTDCAHPEIILKTPKSIEVRVHNDSKHWLWGNNYKSGKVRFEVWARPLATANYQEDYIHKTNPGAGGRFNYTEAKVENELIADATIAGMVADQVITESCQDALEMQLRYCPANPALEQLDTCLVEFDEITDSAKGLVEEINFRFDASGGAPELTMGVKLVPRLPLAAGFGSENLSCYADDGLDKEFELGEGRDDSRELLNLIFG